MNIYCPHCSQTLELTPEVHAQLQGQPHFACPTCQGLMTVPPIPASAPKQAPRRPADVHKAAMQAQRGLNRNMLVLGVVALMALGGLAAFLASRNGGSVFNIFQNTTNQIIHNSYFTQLIANGVTTEKDLKPIAEIRPYGDGFIGISKEALSWEKAQELAKRTGAEVLSIEDSAAGTKQHLMEWLNTTFAAHLESTLWVRLDAQTKVLDRLDVLSVASLDSPRKAALQWNPKSGRTTADPSVATKDLPFANSLGMKFVPVPGTKVLFCIHETRRQDYEAYATQALAVSAEWEQQKFEGIPCGGEASHPVVGVSWSDAQRFCEWLGKSEGKKYRLPTDREWSVAVGLETKEHWTADSTPESLNRKVTDEYPWGGGFPMSNTYQAGNYGDTALQAKVPSRRIFDGFIDGVVTTAPVMSFKANRLGLYDLGGNVWEWVDDWYSPALMKRVLRGGSFDCFESFHLLSSDRIYADPDFRFWGYGFRVVLETSAPAVAAAATNGQAQGTVDALDANIVGNEVRATALQSDGKTIIAGRFTSVLGVPRSNIARLNADGSLDASFDPNANNAVYSVVVQADGKILLGGLFTTLQPNGAASATTRNRIARVNTDGSLDPGFDPNASSSVFCVTVQQDGKILLGGQFTTLQPNGAAAMTTHNRIARVTADGTLDTGFDPNAHGTVYSVGVQADGKILLGGFFTLLQPNGAASATVRNHIARVNSDGTLDVGFDPNSNNTVHILAVQADGKIVIGGAFSTLQPNGAAVASPRQFIARLNADGMLDTGFDPKAHGLVSSLAVQTDGKILLGGTRSISRVNADGSLDTSFDPKANGWVNSVVVQPDGKILLGGQFTTLQPNGEASAVMRSKLARLNK